MIKLYSLISLIPLQSTKKVEHCRYDWHQTGTHVFITIYAKNSIPDQTYVEANPIRIKLYVIFCGDKVFEMDSELRGVCNELF